MAIPMTLSFAIMFFVVLSSDALRFPIGRGGSRLQLDRA